MPILAMSAGRVTAIWGDAYVRQPNGTLKTLHVGDMVKGGTHIITEENGLVEISPTKGPSVLMKNVSAPVSVEQAIAGIEASDPAQLPAAGLAGGANGSLQPGLRVDRVTEATGAAGVYAYTASGDANQGGFGSSADQRPLFTETALPSVSISDVEVNEAAGMAVFTVTLDRPSDQIVTVSYATGNEVDTASPGGDYTSVQGQLIFQPGQTSLTISVPIRNEAEPGTFEADAQGEGRESFVVTLSQAGQAVIDKGVGVAVIRDDGQGALPDDGRTPDDDRPRVESVEVIAADADYVYFGIRLSHASESPIRLSLDVSPGDDSSTGDMWTGGLEYSLDAADGLNENISFLSWRGAPPVDESSAAIVTLPPLTPPGLIIVKVPIFVPADLNAPQIDHVRLDAATQYDITPQRAEMPVLLGEVAVIPHAPVTEGEPVVFDVMLANSLDRDITVKLTLSDGDDQPGTPENERALLGVDTDTQLFHWSPDSQTWEALGSDGVLSIARGVESVPVRVATKDDLAPEDMEFIKLSVSSVDGGGLLTTGGSAQAAIRDNDDDVDPVRAERVNVSPDVPAYVDDGEGVVPLTLADDQAVSRLTLGTAEEPSSHHAPLDIRDLVSDSSNGADSTSSALAMFGDAQFAPSHIDYFQAAHIGHIGQDFGILAAQGVVGNSNLAKLLVEHL
jgi:hypothetical protein